MIMPARGDTRLPSYAASLLPMVTVQLAARRGIFLFPQSLRRRINNAAGQRSGAGSLFPVGFTLEVFNSSDVEEKGQCWEITALVRGPDSELMELK